MRWTSIVAIYTLFWVLSAFLVLPFGVRTHADEEAEGKDSGMVAGQAASAPLSFRPARIAKRATVLAFVLFGVFYLNYVEGWIMPSDLDITGGPPNLHGERG
jgi:predicted secreted protein